MRSKKTWCMRLGRDGCVAIHVALTSAPLASNACTTSERPVDYAAAVAVPATHISGVPFALSFALTSAPLASSVGCFPGSIRSTRCRPGSCAAPFPRRRGRRGSPSACLRTLCGTASPLICSNRTSISGSSKSCSEQPHTTRQPHSERQIYYLFHPQCGETVPILRQFAYRGVDLVAIPQPDGSVACIPAWMTHESSAHHELCVEPGFSLDVLRSLRSEIDALLSFLPSDSKVEKAHDDEEVRRSPTRSIRSGRAACRLGASAEDPSRVADRSAASRNRSGTGRRGGRP